MAARASVFLRAAARPASACGRSEHLKASAREVRGENRRDPPPLADENRQKIDHL